MDRMRLHGLPGVQALSGALSQYNGKFMSGQMILVWEILRHPRESLTRNLP